MGIKKDDSVALSYLDAISAFLRSLCLLHQFGLLVIGNELHPFGKLLSRIGIDDLIVSNLSYLPPFLRGKMGGDRGKIRGSILDGSL